MRWTIRRTAIVSPRGWPSPQWRTEQGWCGSHHLICGRPPPADEVLQCCPRTIGTRAQTVTAGKSCRSMRRWSRPFSKAGSPRARGQGDQTPTSRKRLSGWPAAHDQRCAAGEGAMFRSLFGDPNCCCGYDTHRHRTSCTNSYSCLSGRKIPSITEARTIAFRIPTELRRTSTGSTRKMASGRASLSRPVWEAWSWREECNPRRSPSTCEICQSA